MQAGVLAVLDRTGGDQKRKDYAMRVADQSFDWYQQAAMKARRYYRLSETLLLILSAAIPISAVLQPSSAKTPALLGGLLVVLTGLRSIFHWHDDYLRFSEAREAVEGERRLYLTRSAPYEDEQTRDMLLVQSISKLEQKEMNAWMKIARTKGPDRARKQNSAT
ncbi:DUF4231 domain-containing protein [Actinomadura nitritigenes]|uniref:DUF4231 domain-containing protein n=1 Tax=Actinomadura nitritigenes TaxID=134602 RepID=UPI003D90DAB7